MAWHGAHPWELAVCLTLSRSTCLLPPPSDLAADDFDPSVISSTESIWLHDKLCYSDRPLHCCSY